MNSYSVRLLVGIQGREAAVYLYAFVCLDMHITFFLFGLLGFLSLNHTYLNNWSAAFALIINWAFTIELVILRQVGHWYKVNVGNYSEVLFD